jgi:hypothetical protein
MHFIASWVEPAALSFGTIIEAVAWLAKIGVERAETAWRLVCVISASSSTGRERCSQGYLVAVV